MSHADRSDEAALHELESEVMEEIWRRGETTVRDVLTALNASADKERAYTTVMTTMARLHRKGLLRRRRQGKSDVYSPVFARQHYLDVRARAEVGALVEQYGEVALMHFARQVERLGPDRREQLRRLSCLD